MELIIKTTGRCNFACEFCSAGDMHVKHPVDGKVPQKIKDLILNMKPTAIIITGGEPLLVEPEYYYELHELAPECFISPTTNMKAFYLNPEKFAPLLNEKWFNITTSFQYGYKRKWDKNTVYTEEMFLKVLDCYSAYVPNKKLPTFISVIDESNEDTAIDNVLLAKRLGTVCKLNRAIGVGFQDSAYQRYKMMKIYMDIIDMGLEDYEWNCASRKQSKCPYNVNHACDSTIRCVSIDPDGNLHASTCDEQLSMGIEIPQDKLIMNTKVPIYNHIDYKDFVTPNCAICELFNLCNGCNINRREAKLDPNYCEEMKKLESRIINSEWRL